MSKSLGNVVDPFEVLSRHALDSFRYFLVTQGSFGEDLRWSDEKEEKKKLEKERKKKEKAKKKGEEEKKEKGKGEEKERDVKGDLEKRNDAHLAHLFGNFVFRIFSLVNKNCDGKVPDFDPVKVESLHFSSLFCAAKKTSTVLRAIFVG